MSAVTSLIDELKRRNVLKVVTAYAVAAFVLLQLCDILFPAIGIPDSVIGYVLGILVLGLPFVMAFTWMYEITPEGLKRTGEVNAEDSISHFTGQRINNVIIVLLSLALAFFAWQYFFPSTEQQEVASGEPEAVEATPVQATAEPVDTRPSIAVLPFANMSSDQENEHFSDGLSEEMLNLLAQVDGLRVAGRTSSFFYKDRNQNMVEIGKALNVEHLLEGSVRKSGDTVRITAQLVSTEDGFHLWSKTWDRKLDDIFAVQDEIAGEVTRSLQLTLLSDGIQIVDRTTSNTEAYDLYLRAKKAIYERTIDSMRLAVTLLRQVIVLDPDYAPAYVELALVELLLHTNHGIDSHDATLEKANNALKKAEQLEYFSSDFYAVRGLYHSDLRLPGGENIALAEADFSRAIELNKNNVRAYMWWSTILSESSRDPDRYQRSVALNQKAVALDPLNRVPNGNLSMGLADLGRFDEAIANLDRLIRIDPEYQFYRAARVHVYLDQYKLADAAKALEGLSATYSRYPLLVSRFFYTFNDMDGLLEFINFLPVDLPSIDYLHLFETAMTSTPAELRSEAEVLLLQPDYSFYSQPLYPALLAQGEYDLVRRLIENAAPDFKNDVPGSVAREARFPYDTYLIAIAKLGQTERARRLAQSTIDFYQEENFLGPRGKAAQVATSLLVLGDKDAAIAELDQALDVGWLGYYHDIAHNPLWDELRHDQRLQAIKSTIDRELEAQRVEVYETLMSTGIPVSI